jgi:hypothetical protein
MSLQGILDDIFGPGEQSPSEIYGDNLNRTFERVEQFESTEPIGDPIDGEAVTVRVTNQGTEPVTVTVDFGEQVTPTPEANIAVGETFETTTQVPASVTSVTVIAVATIGVGGGFNSVSATRQIPADGVLELGLFSPEGVQEPDISGN